MSKQPDSVVQARPASGVLVVSGYGLRIGVERGHLVIEDGIAERRRVQRLSRMDRWAKRITIVGQAGTISIDAIRWLHGVGVPLIHLDNDGTVFGVFAPSAARFAEVQRAQALAPELGFAFPISRDLVQEKLKGQLRVLDLLNGSDESREAIQAALAELDNLATLSDMRYQESAAAKAYWAAWRRIPINWKPGQAQRRPRHWETFGTRASPLAGFSPRKAVNPANAVLNYLYAILEVESRIACLSVGLDPFLGFLHADTKSRASLALDIMEPIRPLVDRWALHYLDHHRFSSADAIELRDGQCRLLPPVTQELATTARQWAAPVLRIAQRVVRTLQANELEIDASNSKAARRPRRVVGREYSPAPVPGADPRWSKAAGEKRRQSVAKLVAANREWEQRHPKPHDPQLFRHEILASLKEVPLERMMEVTGLTRSACCLVRQGRMVPHPRHWIALAGLGGL